MDASVVNEYVQPILIALAVMLIPLCARLAAKAITTKLDEGRVLAAATALELKKTNAEEAANLAAQLEARLAAADATATARHKDNVDRFDRIELQTTQTNGKVAEHDKELTALSAQNELLIRLFPGPQQPEKKS